MILRAPVQKEEPSNVTSITQAFFIGSGIAKQAQKIYKNSSKEKIIDALKSYKQEKTRENFEKLLKSFKIIMGSAGFEPATTSPPG